MPAEYGSKSTVQPWFNKWASEGVFEKLMKSAGGCIEEKEGFKVYECFVEGIFSKAKRRGDGIACTKAGKGVEILILLEAKSLPVATYSDTAGKHEGKMGARAV